MKTWGIIVGILVVQSAAAQNLLANPDLRASYLGEGNR